MRREDWEQAVARAVVERAFRARLLTDPTDALTDYGLCACEVGAIQRLQVSSLEQLAAQLARTVPGAPYGAMLAS